MFNAVLDFDDKKWKIFFTSYVKSMCNPNDYITNFHFYYVIWNQ